MTGATKDVDLQNAEAQKASVERRAMGLAQRFEMNVDSARQLTQLADQFQLMSKHGQVTDADRDAMAKSAFAVAGLTPEEVRATAVKAINGDKQAVDQAMEKAAKSLGMTSAGLRDRLLPALGVRF